MTTTIGSRDWVINAQNSLQGENPCSVTVNQRLIQGKKLSKLICFIWANEDPETAGKLDLIFKTADPQSGKLKKLLFANSSEESKDEYNLLLKIFKPEDLPIFKEDENEKIVFVVITNAFQGSIQDASVLNPLTQIVIPYPPCPTVFDDSNAAMSGYAPIKKSELKDWLKQSPNDGDFYPNNPYIPTTCC